VAELRYELLAAGGEERRMYGLERSRDARRNEMNPEIERNLRCCDIFVLLVSRNSMAANYIIDKELEIAREREARGELVIYPLLIEPTPEAGLKRVRDFNLRPRDGKPFQRYPLAERNQHMCDAADEIATIAREIAARKRGTTS
jgi:hypothetical protein